MPCFSPFRSLASAIFEFRLLLLDILVTVVITLVLFFLARRSRKEQSFVGFKSRSFDEKYTGFVLLSVGIVIIVVSVYELPTLLNGNIYYNSPFILSNVSIFGQVVSGELLGLFFAIDLWLTIFGLGSGKFVSLGLDNASRQKNNTTSKNSSSINKVKMWCGRRDLNPGSLAWKAKVLNQTRRQPHSFSLIKVVFRL